MKATVFRFFALCVALLGGLLHASHALANDGKSIQTVLDKKGGVNNFILEEPQEAILLPNASSGDGLVDVLIFIQNVLLKLVLPLVAIGSALYIAYLLFNAEGDESKMKQAWTAVVYAIIAMVAIMLSSLIIRLIS